MRDVTADEVRAMLTREAARYGRTFDEVQAAWDADTLDEPELRDRWLIWGTALAERNPSLGAEA